MKGEVFLLIWAFCITNAYDVSYKDPESIAMGSTQSIKFKVVLNFSEEEIWNRDNSVRLHFNLTNAKSWAMTVLNESLDFTFDDMLWSNEKSLYIHAHVIGVDALNVSSSVVDSEGNLVRKSDNVLNAPVKAILADRTLNNLFTIVMLVMIVVNTVNMGGQLDLEIIKEVFKKPIGPAVGFMSQFVVMPMVKGKNIEKVQNHSIHFSFRLELGLLCLMTSCSVLDFLSLVARLVGLGLIFGPYS